MKATMLLELLMLMLKDDLPAVHPLNLLLILCLSALSKQQKELIWTISSQVPEVVNQCCCSV
jgi:hypothetical protein